MGLIEFIMMKNLFGGSGGNAVDDGFYLAWDGSTEGRDFFTVYIQGIGFNYYKVSDAVLTAEQVNGAEILSIIGVGTCVAAEVNGAVVALDEGEPFAFSGLAGTYSVYFEGAQLDFTNPSKGTYFPLIGTYGHTEYIRKAATA